MSLPTGLLLKSHPIARNQTVASSHFLEGSIIAVIPSFSNVLLPSEKGYRCDSCFRKASQRKALRKCTGCASYWYCDAQCQSSQWKEHHKRICKRYNQYTSSVAFQSLALHEKLDALLLAHLLARISPSDILSPTHNSPMSIFLSLIPSSDTSSLNFPVIDFSHRVSFEAAENLYSRFSNNNFAIHSHLNTIGHGVFPLASLLFNHSCYPNAAPKYVLTQGSILMKVVALREIHPDEEICIPYLDPALVQTRQQILKYTYGFQCSCLSCQGLPHPSDIPSPPALSEELSSVAETLRAFLGLDQSLQVLPKKPKGAMPQLLHCVFHETYLSNLSEIFSKSSHDGQYDLALDVGITLLGAYILIYPPNYPQIGMHLLELAKTAWNMFISSGETDTNVTRGLREQAQVLLNMGREVLMIYGLEGDEDGPLEEVEALQSLLH